MCFSIYNKRGIVAEPQEYVDDSLVNSILDQMGLKVASIPLVKDICRNLATVLAVNGDTDGFIAEQITDAVASLNAFLTVFELKPAEIIFQLNSAPEFIQTQIDNLKRYIA